MAKLTREQLYNTKWDYSYLWEVLVPSAPEPFSNVWFPATSFSHNIVNVVSQSFSIGNREIQIPWKENAPVCDITFYDAEGGKLQKWLEDWVNQTILPRVDSGLKIGANSVSSFRSASREIQFRQMSASAYKAPKEGEEPSGTPEASYLVTIEKYLYVYPDGPVRIQRDSNGASVNSITISFVIVGSVDKFPGEQTPKE